MYKSTRVETQISYSDQKPGTSGLRKPVKTVQQVNYTENFIQSLLETVCELEPANRKLLIGGDGRYYNTTVIPLIVRMAAANGFKELIIGKDGLFSTPACSSYIRANNCVGGILLTASHNPGGPDGDFGIKYNVANGGPAPDSVTNAIFEKTKTRTFYNIIDPVDIPLGVIGETVLETDQGQVLVHVVDAIECHEQLLGTIFDLPKIKSYLARNNICITADAMAGVMGPTVHRIFGDVLGVDPSHLIRCTPLPDFGGSHPDPNLVYAAELVDTMKSGRYEFGVAFDGDGDRNMILGKDGFFVSPSDSLAVITANLNCIPYFAGKKFAGVGRSLPTSGAVDQVAKKLGFNLYETPTGWKYFGSLMDADMISLCGEESFGTGSNHIREKDGIWAALAWLSILSTRECSVEEVVKSHWKEYGRHFYSRHDYETLTTEQGAQVMAAVKSFTSPDSSLPLMGETEVVSCVNFSYTDPVTGDQAVNQGVVFTSKTGSRVIFRLSGTGSSGATVRIYLEFYSTGEIEPEGDVQEILSPLVKFALQVSDIRAISGRHAPTVIT